MRRPRQLLVVVAIALAAACSGGGGERGSSNRPGPRATAAPTTTIEGLAPVGAQPASGGCPRVPARVAPAPDRPRYVLRVDVRLADDVVEGDVTVRFTPDLDIDRLVFRLWPNAPRTAEAGARLEPGPVMVGGHAASVERPDPTILVVPLAATVPAGRSLEASVPWRLDLPGSVDDRISRRDDAVRLGSFFPILAWEPGAGWATEPPTTGFAEASTAPAADFTATVSVPEGLSVLATGVPDGSGRWRAIAVPDFGLSVGRFTTAAAVVDVPHPVRVTVGVHAGIAESPEPYRDQVVAALADFSRRFGPYPWPTLTLAVTPELDGGIEYPTHVMQGPDTLGETTAHEVGHMWFYALVADNQGRDPVLDEGLATWAEVRLEGGLAELRAVRVPPAGRGRAGRPMTYWERHPASYYRSVYVQGAQALAALGDPERADCGLRHYVARTAYRIARPADLLAALKVVFPEARGVLARYGIGT